MGRGAVRAGIGAFLLLLLLWPLSLRHGADGVPLLAWDVLPVRLVLPLHCFVAGSAAAPAAALGDAVEYTDHPVPGAVRWLLCGSSAVYLGGAGVAAVGSGRRTREVLLLVGPPLAVVLVAGAVARGGRGRTTGVAAGAGGGVAARGGERLPRTPPTQPQPPTPPPPQPPPQENSRPPLS
ncbi:hypothetical protein [Streptomyces sp. NPDC051109]|uniref:hypothetical protein n=1 Tax=Streptomyces sp. NPDC051109 TaxID=3365642 RepID=UPI0037A7E7E4